MSRERFSERCHARIKRTPRAEQRFIRFENERKFGEIEAPDVDKRPRALFTRDRYCMRESVSHFPQTNGGKGRRQCQFRCERAFAGEPVSPAAWISLYLSYLNTYNYSVGRSRGQTRGRRE